MTFKWPRLLWIVLAVTWLLLALAWFVWVDQVLIANVLAIVCGYPDAPAKAYADCIAARSGHANLMFWTRLSINDGPWIVVPPLLLLAIGSFVAGRKARVAA